MRETIRLMEEMIRLLLTMTAVLLSVANRASGWILGGLLQGMGVVVEKTAAQGEGRRAFEDRGRFGAGDRRSWGEPPGGFDRVAPAEAGGPGRSADFGVGTVVDGVGESLRVGHEPDRARPAAAAVIGAARREQNREEKVSAAVRKTSKEATRMKTIAAVMWIVLALSVVSTGVGVNVAAKHGLLTGVAVGVGAGCFVLGLAASVAFAAWRVMHRRPERPRPVRGGAGRRIRRASSGENRPPEPIGRSRVVSLRPRGDGEREDREESARL